MRADFFALAQRLEARLRGTEVLLLNLEGEESDFVRLNRNRVRQAGTVMRRQLSLELIDGRRHASAHTDLSGDPDADGARARALLEDLREQLTVLPEDPFLHYATERRDSERDDGPPARPDSALALRSVTAEASGLDLAGIWAAGSLHRGFANSLGQRNWHASDSFHFDWSVYQADDRAVKHSLAGHAWSEARLAAAMREVRRRLEALRRPAVSIRPGRYRAYLAPQAVRELLDMMAWGGFGLKSHRSRSTPLLKMVAEGRRLHPDLTLIENTRDGLAPGFTREGFVKPAQVVLIEAGAYRDCLADARSAKEYGVPVNAGGEYPDALDLAPGDLALDEVLARLGTGLYLDNLWYLNFSDRTDCRVTGMTRFGCFWVQDGELQAPLEAMRFDDTLYHLLGDGLLGLTGGRELILDEGTYGGRSTRSYRLPGALIEGMRFTL